MGYEQTDGLFGKCIKIEFHTFESQANHIEYRMKTISFLLLLFFINSPDTKKYSSVTEVYTITIPETWKVEVEHKKTEIYFKDDDYVGQFEISVRPFLVKTNAKAEYYGLKDVYPDASLSRINGVQVITCTLIDAGSKEYNWVFYHDKYEIWCQYTAVANSDHEDEVKQVETAINAMQFFKID